MNIQILNNEIKIACADDFDISKTFECGQCFRWGCDEKGIYTGVAYGKAATLRQDGSDVYITCNNEDFDTLWRGYFDLDRDYAAAREQLCISDFMRRAADFGKGIRILRQEPWEALCSFILSQNNNIPRIKKLIDTLCREFGEPLEFAGKLLYTFPTAEKLAALENADLDPLRSGYRAKYVIAAARAVADKSIDLDALSHLSPDDARAVLKTLPGVGDKVADCVLLYGLHMVDSFPVDVWMKRALAEHFAPGFDPAAFSPYAGIAQQYIFHYVRNM